MSRQSESEYLVMTPPYCPTVECYEHGDGAEHHVEGCPMFDTLAASSHRLSHAMDEASEAVRPFAEMIHREIRKSYGRNALALLWWDLRYYARIGVWRIRRHWR